MSAEILRWMFPTAQVAWLIAAWIGGATLLSWALNGQKVRQKLINMARAAGILIATAMWFSVLRIVHHEPSPFRSFAVVTVIFLCVTAGDWIAFGLYHLVDEMDMRTWMRAQVKAGMTPVPAQRKPFDWFGITRGWSPRIKRVVGVMLAALLAALACSVTSLISEQSAQEPEPLSVEGQSLSEALVPVGSNLLRNPGFEGQTRTVIFPEVTVFEWWDPYYCDRPYTDQKCPVPLEWNPYERNMGRPEYTTANRAPQNCTSSPYLNRVHSGCNGQQWFGAFRVTNGGVQQTVSGLTPGTYELSAWAAMWISDGGAACLARSPATNQCLARGALYKSDVATADDRSAAHVRLGYDPTCSADAFASSVIWSPDYGYAEGFYDEFQQMTMTIQVDMNCVSVFIGGTNRYAVGNNNFYIDDASLRRMDHAGTATAEPTRTPQPTATPGEPICPTAPACAPTIITATPGASPTASRTPSAQATPAALTPTQLPPGTPIPGTNIPSTPFCSWEASGAKPAEKQTFYVYTDPQFSGLLQRVRGGPGTEFNIVDYLSKGARTRVYWSIWRGGYTWWALDVGCSRWAAQLGSIEIVRD